MIDDVAVAGDPARRPERYAIGPLSGLMSNTDKPLIYFIDGQVRQYVPLPQWVYGRPRDPNSAAIARGEARQNLRVRDFRHHRSQRLAPPTSTPCLAQRPDAEASGR